MLRSVGPDKAESKIEAGPNLITVVGGGLSRVAAALDLSSLEVLSESRINPDAFKDSKIVISGITLERAGAK
jgi:hypothetical protein